MSLAFDDAGDVVVTVPKDRWLQWIAEGDLPGDPPEESASWDFYLGGGVPAYKPGARCYVVAWGMLRGYAPMQPAPRGHRAIVRGGGAVACTVFRETAVAVELPGVAHPARPMPIQGFRGYQRRSWDRSEEAPFPDWATEGLPPALRRDVEQLLEFRSRSAAHRAGFRHWALTGDESKIPRAGGVR